MSTTEELRVKLIEDYDQLYDIALNKAASLLEKSITKAPEDIIDDFIEKAKSKHKAPYWTSDYYDEGVILYAARLITLSQPKAVNSGLIESEKADGQAGSETKYIRPALNNFGKHSTVKYGQMWEALKEEAQAAYFPEDFASFV